MTFESILSRLGERGEKGEFPRQMRQERSPIEGRIRPGEAGAGEEFAPFAPRSPSPEAAPVNEFRPIRPVRPGKARNDETGGGEHADIPNPHPVVDRASCATVEGRAALAADFRIVTTWWQWSPEDVDVFTAWAQQHPDHAAAWIHGEAKMVRDYQDHLHVVDVDAFIGKPQYLKGLSC